jgi:hypothetical protein
MLRAAKKRKARCGSTQGTGGRAEGIWWPWAHAHPHRGVHSHVQGVSALPANRHGSARHALTMVTGSIQGMHRGLTATGSSLLRRSPGAGDTQVCHKNKVRGRQAHRPSRRGMKGMGALSHFPALTSPQPICRDWIQPTLRVRQLTTTETIPSHTIGVPRVGGGNGTGNSRRAYGAILVPPTHPVEPTASIGAMDRAP